MGYPYPDGYYIPLNDPSIPPEELAKFFGFWITGYYAHGDTPETLSTRHPLDEPSPTVARMSPEDLAPSLHDPPTLLDGPDTVILKCDITTGVLSRLREAALFASHNAEVAWPDVEFRYVWCDHSAWVMPWGARTFRAEIEQARKDGKHIRANSIVRMRGANHCVSIPFTHIPVTPLISIVKVHWDEPEKALKALLSDAQSDVHIREVAKF